MASCFSSNKVPVKCLPTQSDCLDNARTVRHFSDLPFELQSEILLGCLPQSPQYPTLDDNLKAPSVFLGVSRALRNVALSTPRLWSSFELTIGESQSPVDLCAKVKLWLRLSRGVALSFSVKYKPQPSTGRPAHSDFYTNSSEIVRVLMTAMSRWEHVQFGVPGKTIMPLVHHSTYNLGGLRSLSFDLQGTWPLHEPIRLLTWGIAWNELTDLHLIFETRSLLTLDECANILSKSNNLRTCTLKAKAIVALVPERIAVSKLKQLKLIVDVDGVSSPEAALISFLQSLEVGGLTELDLHWLRNTDPGQETAWSLHHRAFTSFLAQFNLEKLHFRYLPLSTKQLIECLKLFTELTDLNLDFGQLREFDPISSSFLQSLTVDHPGALVPSLKRLELACHGDALEFYEMVQSRLGTLIHLRADTHKGIWDVTMDGEWTFSARKV